MGCGREWRRGERKRWERWHPSRGRRKECRQSQSRQDSVWRDRCRETGTSRWGRESCRRWCQGRRCRGRGRGRRASECRNGRSHRRTTSSSGRGSRSGRGWTERHGTPAPRERFQPQDLQSLHCKTHGCKDRRCRQMCWTKEKEEKEEKEEREADTILAVVAFVVHSLPTR